MAREVFCFGARSKKFTRQNEKDLTPFFQKRRTTIRALTCTEKS
nr:hypothetical protein [Porphyromonas gingivalis]